MEPANFHHYHQEDDHVPVDSSSFPIPSCYGLSWSQNPLLTCTNNSINSRNLVPCLDTGTDSMAQDLGFPWSSSSSNNGMGYPIDNFMTHELQRLSRIKDEFSISSISTAGSTGQPAKRPASKFINAKATQSVSVKKSKLEPRPSSAPFQVRKEKLGDRIAAIQQLVAPFGKTDTASVLMEAIGYIKFLQTQVETLSVPYMKSTDKTSGIPTRRGHLGEGNKETKRDLRSRGLCLVPLSCLSYITGGGEGIWPGS
ncbi:Myc-type, basic helix-loop-helix (bHLH) domain-containing protein [Cynara cardunculus var. scolymus]|uniref:Myc-type, basic helix-loop-helix (BHLH) domain-containing protein n=1 Tax=Cynara cardunculus var. scolymus TaxID=59895 RepID=A0A103YCG5_CYNCS|nr:Myc-type, basic helix-loop-helix (bHLH) domain-containing protein [Cynara cardunculus var. scolymus]